MWSPLLNTPQKFSKLSTVSSLYLTSSSKCKLLDKSQIAKFLLINHCVGNFLKQKKSTCSVVREEESGCVTWAP